MSANDYVDITGGYAAPKMEANEVKGLVSHASTHPDRWFYLLDEKTDAIWEIDGYERVDPVTKEPYWELLIQCPRCRQNLRLDSRRKPIEISDRGLETGEPFRCTYLSTQDGFTGKCNWACELKPPSKTMIIPMTDAKNGRPGMCKIDAIIKPA